VEIQRQTVGDRRCDTREMGIGLVNDKTARDFVRRESDKICAIEPDPAPGRSISAYDANRYPPLSVTSSRAFDGSGSIFWRRR